MLSYHADMDAQTNPFELGLDRLVNLDMEADFIGKDALRRIRDEGVTRKQVGLVLDTAPLPGPNTEFWPIMKFASHIGKVTSAVHSPRLDRNIALAMVRWTSPIWGSSSRSSHRPARRAPQWWSGRSTIPRSVSRSPEATRRSVTPATVAPHGSGRTGRD
jgi:glycine cleavage system aminomethyltransferase T